LGELHYFLRMQIIKAPNGLTMTQRKFATELLKEFQCEELSATSYPLGPVSKISSHEEPLADVTNYIK